MRHAAQIVALLSLVALTACTPFNPAPVPAPPATPGSRPAETKPATVNTSPAAPKPASAPASAAAPQPAAAIATPGTWQDTSLPTSAAPGASSDDSADERQDGEHRGARTRLSADLATPRVVPTASTPVLAAGLTQDVYVSGLMLPVAFEFAPDGRTLFVNELYGKVRLVEDGKLKPDPLVALPTTQGLEQGALGLALDPAFSRNRWFYVLYSQTVEGKNEPRRNRIVRFTEHDGLGTDETVIFDNLPIGKPGPENLNGDHNGGRIGFGPDGKLYVTVGDTARRSEAKKEKGLVGKVLRLNADGSIPSDNPDPDEPIFAMGFRSPFGLDFQPGTGLPWVSDNGPQGHDEINRVTISGNYGWPDEAGRVANGDAKLLDPVWESSIERYGPTGLAFYTGDAVPEWKNDLFFCDWNTGSLWRLNLQPPAYDTAGQKEMIAQPCRLNVRNGPDGALYFSDHHAIYRLGPPRS
jgi:glucose/arabinose dehydrogenase